MCDPCCPVLSCAVSSAQGAGDEPQEIGLQGSDPAVTVLLSAPGVLKVFLDITFGEDASSRCQF